MRILGIDPGSRVTGYALLETAGRGIHYLSSGVIQLHQRKNFNERVGIVVEKMSELVEKLSPSVVSMESLIYVKGPTSLIKLAQIRGAILASLCPQYEKTIFEYSPNFVKSSVSGYGHATKEGIQKSLNLILGKQKYETDDASDATAIALCHYLNMNVGMARKSSSQKGRGLAGSLQHAVKGL